MCDNDDEVFEEYPIKIGRFLIVASDEKDSRLLMGRKRRDYDCASVGSTDRLIKPAGGFALTGVIEAKLTLTSTSYQKLNGGEHQLNLYFQHYSLLLSNKEDTQSAVNKTICRIMREYLLSIRRL